MAGSASLPSSVVPPSPPTSGGGASSGVSQSGSLGNSSVSQLQQQGAPNPLKDLAFTVYYVALGVIALSALVCVFTGVGIPVVCLGTALVAHFMLCHGGPSISTPPGQIFASLFGGNSGNSLAPPTPPLRSHVSHRPTVLRPHDAPTSTPSASAALTPTPALTIPPLFASGPTPLTPGSPSTPVSGRMLNLPPPPLLPSRTSTPAATPFLPPRTGMNSEEALSYLNDLERHPQERNVSSSTLNPPRPPVLPPLTTSIPVAPASTPPTPVLTPASSPRPALNPISLTEPRPLPDRGSDKPVDVPDIDLGFFFRMLNYWKSQPSHEEKKVETKLLSKIDVDCEVEKIRKEKDLEQSKKLLEPIDRVISFIGDKASELFLGEEAKPLLGKNPRSDGETVSVDLDFSDESDIDSDASRPPEERPPL
ncbi:MAG: hypothetical protein Q8L98_06385 [Chlamydiales bacterium]|nr:hypothetical protein [Chlamydiales bacterium]